MIQRYRDPRIEALFSDQTKYDTWLKVELAVCAVYHAQGRISDDEYAALKTAQVDAARVLELEAETRHDVVAFTRALSERLGPEKRWIHYGLTSTDVVDTANALLLKQANDIIDQAILDLIKALKHLALTHQYTLCMGRTHGMHAELTSFGFKFALFYDEMVRQKARFDTARKDVEQGKISGAVGTSLYTGTALQDAVCQQLGLASARLSTQVLARDHHAHYINTLALIAGSCEKIALEIRHLQRTEVGEVEEGFRSGQKGSSAMPQKRNPIGSENITGLVRMVRAYLIPAHENIALWHERDISHSSVERIMLPDITHLSVVILSRLSEVLNRLVVKPDRMLDNIAASYNTIYAQALIHQIMDQSGMAREQAYDLTQTIAMQALQTRTDFKVLVLAHKEIRAVLSEAQIHACFDAQFYLKTMEALYQRVGLTKGGSHE